MRSWPGVQIFHIWSWRLNRAVFKAFTVQQTFFRIYVTFFWCTTESGLTCCCTVWYPSCTKVERKALNGVVKTAQWITKSLLPSLDDTNLSNLHKGGANIIRDVTHPGLFFISPISSGRLRTIGAWTNRLLNRFFTRAVDELWNNFHINVKTTE